MTTSDSHEILDVLDRVRWWTPDMKVALARKVLETLESPEVVPPPKRMALDEVVGILRTDAAPPDDRQCEEILDEERARKYG